VSTPQRRRSSTATYKTSRSPLLGEGLQVGEAFPANRRSGPMIQGAGVC